jgi:hypothetical protein
VLDPLIATSKSVYNAVTAVLEDPVYWLLQCRCVSRKPTRRRQRKLWCCRNGLRWIKNRYIERLDIGRAKI